MSEKKENQIEDEALCSRHEIAKAFSTTGNNIGRTYINPKQNQLKKHEQFKILDMGSYCKLNNITPDMLRLFVEYGVKLTNLMAGVDAGSDKKVVIMTPEELEEYEQYKKFKAFQDHK